MYHARSDRYFEASQAAFDREFQHDGWVMVEAIPGDAEPEQQQETDDDASPPASRRR
jgi:hypothetical protein